MGVWMHRHLKELIAKYNLGGVEWREALSLCPLVHLSRNIDNVKKVWEVSCLDGLCRSFPGQCCGMGEVIGGNGVAGRPAAGLGGHVITIIEGSAPVPGVDKLSGERSAVLEESVCLD